jgi:hypothetical protein
MGFIMDGLDAEEYDRQYGDRQLVRRIATYFRPQLRRMAVVSLMILLNTLSNTGLPIYISRSVDRLQEDTSTNTILTITLVTALFGCVAWLFNAVRHQLSAQAVGNVVLHIREDAFDAVIKRDLSFYDSFPSGKIVSRVTSDTQAFSQVVTLTVDLMSQTLFVFVLMGYLFSVNVQLALMVMAIAPVIILAAIGFRKIARQAVTQSRRVQAESVRTSGIDQWDRCGKNVPPGTRHLRRISGRERAVVPYQPADGLHLQQHLSDPEPRGGDRYGPHRVLRRQERPGWHSEHRGLAAVYPGAGHVLVPADQHRFILEPVPVGAGRRRACVRPD